MPKLDTTGSLNMLNEYLTKYQNDAYQSKYQTDIDKSINDYKANQDFKYNPGADEAYIAAKNAYQRNAVQSMKDTLGASAALTGGYTNSWGQSAAQQAYDNVMKEVTATLLPQYKEQARNDWQSNQNARANLISLLSDRDNADYSKWLDTQNKNAALAELARSMYENNRQYDYQQERDRISDDQWNRQFDYQQNRDKISDDQWRQQFDYQRERDSVSDSQWEKQYQASLAAAQTKAASEASSNSPKNLNSTEYDRVRAIAEEKSGKELISYLNTQNLSDADLYNILYQKGIKNPASYVVSGGIEPKSEKQFVSYSTKDKNTPWYIQNNIIPPTTLNGKTYETYEDYLNAFNEYYGTNFTKEDLM